MSHGVRIYTLEQESPWRSALASSQSPSQGWDYARALSLGGQRPMLADVEAGGSRLRFCFFEREFLGHVDIATCLGLGGASLEGDPAPAWQAWREHARARGWVAGYLQLGEGVQGPEDSSLDRVVEGNEVFVLDLSSDPLERASAIVRRKVRRAVQLGVEPVLDRGAIGDALCRWHPALMRRFDAGRAHRHSDATLRAFASLPDGVSIGAALGGEVIAASAFACAGDRAEFVCNAGNAAGRNLSAWLLSEAIARLRRLGVRELLLGGGIVPGDGLYQFKQRFNGARRTLRALHQIYDPGRYRELCAAAPAAPAAPATWFPAYRAAAARSPL